jgi:hypothetical protein
MQIMNHFFIMGQMALPAIPRFLQIMLELCSAGMADRAGHSRVRSELIVLGDDQRNLHSRPFLGISPLLSVTVKADPSHPPFIFRTHEEVTSHACFILLRKRRQSLSLLVACTALLMAWLGRIETVWLLPEGNLLPEEDLFMGIMTGQTLIICFGAVDLLGSMDTLTKLVLCIPVANKAMVCFKKLQS